jgi:hypothetical protein
MDAKKLKEAIEWARTRHHWAVDGDDMVAVLADAAEAHLATLPRTKEVEVWRVEWVDQGYDGAMWTPCCAAFKSKIEADAQAHRLAEKAMHKCIRVTGPHVHVVPA